MDRCKVIRVFLLLILCTLCLFRLETNQAAAADALDNWHVNPENISAAGLSFGNGVFVAVGYAGEILTSADGVTWTSSTSGTTENLAAVAYGTYGNGRFVAVGYGGTVSISADNGMNWIAVSTGTGNFENLKAIAYGNGKFVALGEGDSGGTIITSDDGGMTWRTVKNYPSYYLQKITYGNGVFVAGGMYLEGVGVTLTSANGMDWTPKTLNLMESFWGLTFGGVKFVAVGDRFVYPDFLGTILTSANNGLTWQSQPTGLMGTFYLNDVVCGNKTFVVVGEEYTGNYVMGIVLTSTDGGAWTRRPAVAQYGALLSVVYGNGTFVALASDGTILQSDPLSLQSVAINNGAAYTANISVTLTLSAGDPDSAAEMQFSHDNINWSAEEAFSALKSWTLTEGDGQKHVYVRFKDPLGNWSAPLAAAIILDTQAPVASAQPPGGAYAGTQLVALSASEPSATIFYTLNGTLPTVNSPVYQEAILISNSQTLRYFARDPAGNSGEVKTEGYQISLHPLDNWHQRAQDTSVYSLAYGNGVFVVVGDYGAILTSPDGLVWTTSRPTSTLESNLAAVAYESGIFAAVGDGGTILTSADNGATWTSRTVVMSEYLLAIAAGDGKFIAVGDAGVMVTSSDNGVTWVPQSPATAASLYGITYGNSVFVAVGDSGTILMSEDSGMTWTIRNSGTIGTLWTIAYGKGMFVAAGDNGTILTSADNGVTWTPQTSGVSADLIFYGIAYGNGVFVAVGENYVSGNGQIISSSDGATWIARTSPVLQDQLLAVAFGRGTFVALSAVGAVIQSDLLKGDVNNDQRTDLQDLILYLRVLSGEQPAEVRPDYPLSGTDPDGDGRIGVPDVIFILQKIAGLR